MKCTLRKVNEGVVATVDIPPKKGQPYYNFLRNWANANAPYDYKSSNFETVIASNFKIAKKLKVNYKGSIMAELVGKTKDVEFNVEYEYTETETNVIIKL